MILATTKNVLIPSNFVERDARWQATATELMKMKQLIKQYEAVEAQLMEELKKLSEGVSSRSGNFYFECTTRKGSVEYARIPELKHVDLDRYRKESVEVWKLSLQVELL